tara:strand:- start:1100 stop:1690 length:591 start_codon:yes stop_codon:yes gene_type:complete
MFTGIVQGLAKVEDLSNGVIKLSTNLNLSDCKIGSSLLCNGVCLTITNIINIDEKFIIQANIGEETTLRSNLSSNMINNKINLEKSLKLGDEVSGHFVYGHVDTITKIIDIKNLDNSWEFKFTNNFKEKSFFIVEKGSISINGISLTIANINSDYFTISIIPHTYLNTNLQFAKINDLVNIEFDYLARFFFNKYDN